MSSFFKKLELGSARLFGKKSEKARLKLELGLGSDTGLLARTLELSHRKPDMDNDMADGGLLKVSTLLIFVDFYDEIINL